jgi:hypothetical protein
MDTRELREKIKRAKDGERMGLIELGAALSPDVLEGLCDRIDEQNDIIQRQQGAVFAAGMALVPGGSGIEFRNVRAEQSEAERDALRAENERLRDALRECVYALTRIGKSPVRNLDEIISRASTIANVCRCACGDLNGKPCFYCHNAHAFERVALQGEQSTQPAPEQGGKARDIADLVMRISQEAYAISQPENQPGTKMAVRKSLITKLVNLACNNYALQQQEIGGLVEGLKLADAYFSQIVGPDETPRKEIRVLFVDQEIKDAEE